MTNPPILLQIRTAETWACCRHSSATARRRSGLGAALALLLRCLTHRPGPVIVGEALVEASDGALHLYGIGYANELGDPEEGSYEHIIAYDPSTDRYLDAMGSHTRADLLSSYAPKAAWAQAVGEVVIEPFNPEQNLSIPFPDAALRARAASVARNARYGKGAKR